MRDFYSPLTVVTILRYGAPVSKVGDFTTMIGTGTT